MILFPWPEFDEPRPVWGFHFENFQLIVNLNLCLNSAQGVFFFREPFGKETDSDGVRSKIYCGLAQALFRKKEPVSRK